MCKRGTSAGGIGGPPPEDLQANLEEAFSDGDYPPGALLDLALEVLRGHHQAVTTTGPGAGKWVQTNPEQGEFLPMIKLLVIRICTAKEETHFFDNPFVRMDVQGFGETAKMRERWVGEPYPVLGDYTPPKKGSGVRTSSSKHDGTYQGTEE